MAGSHGETPLQNYNALLATQRLQEMTDCVLNYDNNELYDILEKAFLPIRGKLGVRDIYNIGNKSNRSETRISTSKFNEVIAVSLAGALAPYDMFVTFYHIAFSLHTTCICALH